MIIYIVIVISLGKCERKNNNNKTTQFAIISAALNVKRAVLFDEGSSGRVLPDCWTDDDFIRVC